MRNCAAARGIEARDRRTEHPPKRPPRTLPGRPGTLPSAMQCKLIRSMSSSCFAFLLFLFLLVNAGCSARAQRFEKYLLSVPNLKVSGGERVVSLEIAVDAGPR